MRLLLACTFLLICAASADAAQRGSARQRSACTDDAYKFCERYVPDAAAVESCLKANIGGLSRACKAQMQGAAAAKKRGRRH
ncbi:hypothetical protein [Methylosinus sp. LW3]|jgi:hypothetical protein|uniref:hypothetical protein n=1 Tax=Methylosinus sp. LW3 TaxID=107635 RepID=UPI000467D383|nr:hypothetical protein [Methylosinus sp. LW3]